MTTNAPSTGELVRSYLAAKRVVVDGGFAHEIAWQATAGRVTLTPAAFVREAAWVVLSCGMRELVVRALFGRLAQALRDFDPTALSADRQAARAAGLVVFGHEGKINAILDIAVTADRLGEDGLREVLWGDPQTFLCSLPYVGPVTWRHLAKNLGVQVAKPDRHLVRVARATSRPSVDVLCDEISAWLGEPVPVVDVVLWRWSVLHSGVCRERCDSILHDPTAGAAPSALTPTVHASRSGLTADRDVTITGGHGLTAGRDIHEIVPRSVGFE